MAKWSIKITLVQFAENLANGPPFRFSQPREAASAKAGQVSQSYYAGEE